MSFVISARAYPVAVLLLLLLVLLLFALYHFGGVGVRAFEFFVHSIDLRFTARFVLSPRGSDVPLRQTLLL